MRRSKTSEQKKKECNMCPFVCFVYNIYAHRGCAVHVESLENTAKQRS